MLLLGKIRRVVLAASALALIAGCATPKNENVSEQGPERSTSSAEPTATSEATTTTALTTTTAAQPVEVGRWKGDTTTDTENITVSESWELHWIVSGGAGSTVEWRVPGESFPADYRSLKGSGSSLIREGGTFYLHIGAYGATYEIWAVDVPN